MVIINQDDHRKRIHNEQDHDSSLQKIREIFVHLLHFGETRSVENKVCMTLRKRVALTISISKMTLWYGVLWDCHVLWNFEKCYFTFLLKVLLVCEVKEDAFGCKMAQ